MPMLTAKAFFTVTAGIIPGQVMPEYSRQWGYTSDDYEKDLATPEDRPTIFARRLAEAYAYAIEISSPRSLNWVRVEWMWL